MSDERTKAAEELQQVILTIDHHSYNHTANNATLLNAIARFHYLTDIVIGGVLRDMARHAYYQEGVDKWDDGEGSL